MASRRVGRRSYYSILNPTRRARYVLAQRSNLQAYSNSGSNAAIKFRQPFLISGDPSGFSMPQFAAYAALYEQFKVLSFKLTFRCVNRLQPDVGQVSTYPTLYIRTCYDHAITGVVPSAFDVPYLSRRIGVRRFTFSQERTEFHHTVYPRALDRGQYDGSNTYQVYKVVRGGWQDSDFPYLYYYGVEAIFDYVSSQLGVWVGITWNVLFRNPRGFVYGDVGSAEPTDEDLPDGGAEARVAVQEDIFDLARLHAEKDTK